MHGVLDFSSFEEFQIRMIQESEFVLQMESARLLREIAL